MDKQENDIPINDIPIIQTSSPCSPPEWALLQRQIVETLNQAALEFVERYTRPDGTLIWREQWPGMDGSDDPYEGFMNFPLFYALGGSQEVHQVSRKLWDAITWQWTEYGQIHREFDAYYDWMHHGESSLFIYFLGLADPTVLKDRQRSIRFADMYTGDDPDAPNYDKAKKLIRSPINGSRGPRFHQTMEDWCTHREVLDHYPPPFEDIPGVTGSTCQWTDDHIYAEVLQRMNERMAKGDIPLNLTATGLVAHAYMYTADDRYRQWILEYLGAWKERTLCNGGITPDNVGLSGEIGEHMDGKWWGGYYGWRWPHGSFSIIEPLVIAGCNAALIEGDLSYLDLARSQMDMLWSLRKEQDGQWLVPSKHLESGWTSYAPMNPWYPLYCWYLSMDDEDLERVERLRIYGNGDKVKTYSSKGFLGNHGAWFTYIRGGNPEYPQQILQENLALIHKQIHNFRGEQGDPSSWDVHHWQNMTPMIMEGLVQTMLGAPMHIYHGGLLHARVRYFDGQAKRPGLPNHVAALVEHLTADFVTLSLVNTDSLNEKQVIIQAGNFGEHCFHEAAVLNENHEVLQTLPVNGKWVEVHLAPGAGVRLIMKMSRYVHRPSYDTPWVRQQDYAYLLKGRDSGTG